MHLVSALSEAGMLQRHGLSPRRRSTPLAGSSVAVERSCFAGMALSWEALKVLPTQHINLSPPLQPLHRSVEQRLLLRSDLVCVAWSIRGLGGGGSSRCWFTS